MTADSYLPPIAPDLVRRQQQLEDAQYAYRSALEAQNQSIADLMADVTGASVEQRTTYRKLMLGAADLLALSRANEQGILVDTITLMIMNQPAQFAALRVALLATLAGEIQLALHTAIEQALVPAVRAAIADELRGLIAAREVREDTILHDQQ